MCSSDLDPRRPTFGDQRPAGGIGRALKDGVGEVLIGIELDIENAAVLADLQYVTGPETGGAAAVERHICKVYRIARTEAELERGTEAIRCLAYADPRWGIVHMVTEEAEFSPNRWDVYWDCWFGDRY